MKNYLDSILKTSEKIVGAVLRDVPDTRGDDKELLLEVWERQGLHLTSEQKYMFKRCLSAETITRCRRMIQERGFYRDTKKYQQRQMLFESTKQ